MLLFFLLLACGESLDTSDPCHTSVDWDSWGHGFFLTWCSSCHSATTEDRHGAPENTVFDQESDILMWRDRINIRVLQEQDMPVGGGISDVERMYLQEYLQYLERCEEQQ